MAFDRSARARRIDAQVAGARPFDTATAMRLLRECKAYVGRHASIGAQHLAAELNEFLCKNSHS